MLTMNLLIIPNSSYTIVYIINIKYPESNCLYSIIYVIIILKCKTIIKKYIMVQEYVLFLTCLV